MNHQVKHHVHVEGAGREDREPVGLKEHGAAQARFDGQHSGVETLQVPRLQDAPALVRPIYQIVGLLQARSQRFLHQQIEARIQQGRSHSMMVHGGNGHRSCIEPQVG